MTRTSSLRALLFLLPVAIAIAAVGLMLTGREQARAITTKFGMSIDCDASTPLVIDTACTYPSGTTSVTVAIVAQNNSGSSSSIGAFQFDAISVPQPKANPTAIPDFDESGVGASGTWNCSLLAPEQDSNPDPNVADSFLGCFLGINSPPGPTYASGGMIRLATITYQTINGSATLSLQGGTMGDNDQATVMDQCADVTGVNDNACYGATLQIGAPPTDTPTNTPTNTATNTPTSTATKTNTPTPTDTSTPTNTPTATNTPTPQVGDTDNDGLLDSDELLIGTNPNDPDSDDDGLPDGQEVNQTLTDPLDADTDNDGLSDGTEVGTTNTNPHVADSDGDGLSDGYEVNTSNTNPNDSDTDDDGIHDGPEVNTFLTDPNDPDSDDDGLSDLGEIVIGTNPNNADTDGDTLPDGQEVNVLGTSPLLMDTDGDGLNDNVEVNTTNTNPNDNDTDNDGLSDGTEVNTTNTDPNDTDSDNDQVSDGGEVNTYHSNPNSPDTDADTMPDGFEVLNGCLNVLVNDAAADPDGDAVSNVGELSQTTLPCDPDTDDDGFKDKPRTAHTPTNVNPAEDNCILNPNPSQTNSDGDFIDLPASFAFDDLTHPKSDALGDACDSDADNDGLANTVETSGPPCQTATGQTDPLNRDTDADRALDGAECAVGTNPVNAASKPSNAPPGDTDHDGLSDGTELFITGTNPAVADTDGDKMPDGVEFLRFNSSGTAVDSDSDGCADGREIASVNGDRQVNVIDLMLIATHAANAGQPNYVTGFDVNRDGQTNVIDLLLTANNISVCP